MDPFDDPSADSRVVIDAHGRACLWPAWCPVPHGWATALCPAPYAEALAFLRSHDDEVLAQRRGRGAVSPPRPPA